MIIWITAMLLSAGGVHADGSYKVTINGKNCEELVTAKSSEPVHTPLDYHFSDLEGLFYTYLAKMQNLNEVSPSRVDYFLKDMLSMKAEILNDALSILPYVVASPMNEARQNQMLSSLYQIIDTMGIPGTVYGFEIDDQGNLRFPGKKRAKRSSASARSIAVAKAEAIGFLGGVAPERDLREGLHRSIGFGAHTVSEEMPPQRKGGAIQRSISPDHPEQIMILDGETGGMYVLPVSLVEFLGGQADGKIYRLEFNNDIREWVVSVENLNNPTGRIGF